MTAEIRKVGSDKSKNEVTKTEKVLKSPVGSDVVPQHPVLDIPVEQKAYTRREGLDRVVFGVTALIAIGFLVWGFVSTDSLASASAGALSWVMNSTGWLFVLTASGFVVFVVWLAVSRYGNIPLGRDDEEPEFRTVSWVAMMFSAGMGIGLMFFGVSEPLSHFVTPPPGTGEPGDPAAAQTAMATTLFHWTLHPWAIYAVVGLAIAYGVYRKGRLQLVSAAFEPLLGERANGPWGKVIDMLAIFATLFGSAASLGLGALQIRSGLQIVSGIGQVGNTILVVIIAVLTVAFVLSAVSGVARGIQWLSNINMVLAVVLAVFIFLVGPTVFMLNLIPTSIGSYVEQLAMMSARTGAEGADVNEWLQSWTIFYWAWWISWTPFVGMFIARISRGRTIRQFIAGVLLVPSVVSLVWFCVFGGAAIREQQNGVDLAGEGSVEQQLFGLLDQYPIATIASVVVMVLVAIFFVSGADAASIVMGSLSERGTIKPTRPTVIFWGVATGAVAAVMLLVGGEDALNGLQTITIIAALPFVLVMVGLAVSLVRDLRRDPMVVRRQYAVEAVNSAVVAGVTQHGDDFVIAVEKDPQAGDGGHAGGDAGGDARPDADTGGGGEDTNDTGDAKTGG
ncbi:BCCT family transporter [Mycolicibacterium goodii]|uniref:BCCT family transporter n=1 Tax=Mycolicibacterium goodii TaxID=134601 RepID=UPI001FED7F77|nr:BCCT family transporter [Mycolicibacterium goodii]ULN49407.1 BCCT family transporter [Mycolicibacterium goodii]